MIGNLLAPELKSYIAARDFAALRDVLCQFNGADIAEILADVSAADKAVLLRILPHQLATEVFDYLSFESQEELVHALGQQDVAEILNDMPPDDRTALLEELPAAATQKLLNLLSPAQRKIAAELLGYPKGSIGRRMTPNYVAIKQAWRVSEVLEHLRREGRRHESLNQLYVVDDAGLLVAFARLRDIVIAEPETSVGELVVPHPSPLRAMDDQETAIAAFQKYDATMLPVVDSGGILVGVLTVDDILDLAQREATKDIQRLGGSEALDEPYLKITMQRMIRKRAPWLVVLFLSEMLTTTAMGFFEGEIAKAVVLAMFLPLIISSGGNSGSQATTLIIRAMAVGEVRLRDWWHVMRREIFAGFTLGLVLGTIGFLRIGAWSLFSTIYGPHWVLIGITIFFSLIGVVMWGTLAGSMLPFVLKRVGLDPAASSAPFVATLVDVTGLIIYFTIAYEVLRGTLL